MICDQVPQMGGQAKYEPFVTSWSSAPVMRGGRNPYVSVCEGWNMGAGKDRQTKGLAARLDVAFSRVDVWTRRRVEGVHCQWHLGGSRHRP
jgi:hypothetical protein